MKVLTKAAYIHLKCGRGQTQREKVSENVVCAGLLPAVPAGLPPVRKSRQALMARAAPTRQACKRGKVPARFPTQALTWSGYEGMISAGRAIKPQPSTPSVLFGVSVMA